MSQKLSDKILSGDFIRIFSIDFLLYCRYCGIRRSIGKARTSAHCPHKKGSCLQDSPPAAGRESDIFIFAAVRSPGEFLFNRKFRRNFLLNKKESDINRSLFYNDLYYLTIFRLSSCLLNLFRKNGNYLHIIANYSIIGNAEY